MKFMKQWGMFSILLLGLVTWVHAEDAEDNSIPDLDQIADKELSPNPSLTPDPPVEPAAPVAAAETPPVNAEPAPTLPDTAPPQSTAELPPAAPETTPASVAPSNPEAPAAPVAAAAPPETPPAREVAAEQNSDLPPPAEVDAEPIPVSPSVAAAVPTPAVASPTAQPSVEITNLEFKMQSEKSQILISSRGKLKYRELPNPQVRQFVYLFEGADTPQRLQRAYDTSEFRSPVALFTILQMPDQNPPMSKLIVQMREGGKFPTVLPTDKGLTIEFPAADKKLLAKNQITESAPSVIAGESDSPKELVGNAIDLEIKGSDIQDVLRLLAKTSGYNIVVGDDVQGKVGTLSLKRVPWDQAFTLVLQAKKLGYVRQGKIIRVATLASLKTERDERVASEESLTKVEPLRTILIPINFAKADDLAAQARNLLSSRGVTNVDSRTNTIIVRDIDSAVTRIQKLFAALDSPPARVSIAAKVVEMSSKFTRNFGINATRFSSGLGGVNLSYQSNFNTQGNPLVTLSSSQFANLLTEFAIAELDGTVQSLANPQVTVVANQKASVNASVSVAVVNNDAVAGGQLLPGVQQVTANLLMEVTPIVSNDGSIFMTVHVKNEIPDFSDVKNLRIEARNVNTQVLVDNGDTAVIGGIFSDTVNRRKEGVPFLMRIPIVGFFFSGNRFIDTKSEIFMFLTAKILNSEASLRKTL